MNSFPPLKRLLHHIFTTIITPQGGGRGRLTKTQRILFFCLFKNIPVDLPQVMKQLFVECINNHIYWPYAAQLTGFFKRKKFSLKNETCIEIPKSNIYNMNFIHKFMKFKVIDGKV